ncbi:MAG: hypothetical protein M3R38_07790 [Actinomycetota bacterium]|nr:hypothetical protein [Actinomycetota bacterium]MDP9484557.1 hypothetical protein [Actinomycetota bacterium]
MRLAGLYAGSRLAGYALAVLALLALVSWAALGLLSRPFAVPGVVLVPVLVFAPLAAACVVVAGASSPFGETERTASYGLPALRFVHLAGLLACAVLALLVAALAWGPNHGGWMLARNLLGFAGLALLAARAVGGRLSWTAPFVFVTVAAFMGRAETREKPERDGPLAELMGLIPAGEYEWWAWPLRPGHDPYSWAVVLGLVLVGLWLVCLYGARDLSGEEQ